MEKKDVYTKVPGLMLAHSAASVPETADTNNLDDCNRQSLLYALQTSLDLPRLFSIFFQQINKIVPCQGIVYHNLEQQLCLSVGNEQLHSCNYQLTLEAEHLGEIAFSRNKMFTQHEQEKLETLLGTLVLPIRNAIHYRTALLAASIDPLTGLKNRRSFDDHLEREMSLAKRNGTDLSMLVMDVDHFKHVNDTAGHLAGDMVLAQIANILTASARNTDLTFRYAGDEFLLLLPDMDSADSKIIINRINNNIAAHCFEYEGKQIPVSLSIGCATLSGDMDPQDFFEAADTNMYIAKTRSHCSGQVFMPEVELA